MSMTSRGRLRRLRPGADQRGFTLVELLIGMAAGLVVASGLFTILDVTLHQTTRTFSRVDATQRARVTLDRIENEMHSACVENKTVPIYQGSTASTLKFWSQYGNGSQLTPVLHVLSFNSSKLTDDTYPVASGAEPSTWAPGSSATETNTLLTNVDQSGSTPVFQYYTSSVSGQAPVTPPAGGLPRDTSASSVTRVTEVRITLVVRPAGGSNEDSSLTPNTVSNSVFLRLTPFPNPGTVNQSFDPCE